MAIEIIESLSGPVTVLRLKGRITVGEGTAEFRNRIALILDGAKWFKEKWGWSLCVVLDMAGVEFVDSSGVGALVGAFASARNQEARIKLANLTQALLAQLVNTKIATVFDIYSSVEEAKVSCGASPVAAKAEKLA